ncbi:MAG: 23S rRNA (adenine(2030)-N(6))-methyltransferase RlmJ, partial [Hyphomicrobium sp.]
MNYRHVYHAGNFADVMKHAILALAIEHLKLKPAPFRIIDTHAGAGHTALDGDAASRTGEWRDGVGRLLSSRLPPDAAVILEPYLAAIRAANGGAAELSNYPGSPQIARSLMRRGDSLVANELHPADHAELARHFAGDPQTKVLGLDGWTALKSLLPPKERRGIVLVDPPFEEPGEFHRLADSLRDAVRRFETGIYLLWYPVKDHKRTRSFLARLSEIGLPKLAVAELLIRKPVNPDLFNGCGLVIVNPPYLLGDKLEIL